MQDNLGADDQTILIEVAPSTARRYFAVAVLGLLGALLVFIGFTRPPEVLAWQLFLIGFGAVVLWFASRLYRATDQGLVLTGAELRDTSGRVLFKTVDVTGIERGVLAFKPSNGFMVRTAKKEPGAWAPGLWWRLGRNVGIGGVTSAGQSKAMAEILMVMLAQRDA